MASSHVSVETPRGQPFAWAEGRAMTLEQAIEYALAEKTD
jgi:hypothetical protein